MAFISEPTQLLAKLWAQGSEGSLTWTPREGFVFTKSDGRVAWTGYDKWEIGTLPDFSSPPCQFVIGSSDAEGTGVIKAGRVLANDTVTAQIVSYRKGSKVSAAAPSWHHCLAVQHQDVCALSSAPSSGITIQQQSLGAASMYGIWQGLLASSTAMVVGHYISVQQTGGGYGIGLDVSNITSCATFTPVGIRNTAWQSSTGNLKGIDLVVGSTSSSGVVRGLNIGAVTAGSGFASDSVAIYVENYSAHWAYGLYVADTSAANVVMGRFGIGVIPATKFHVKITTDCNILFGTVSSDSYIAAYNDALSAFTDLRIYGAVILLNEGGGNVGIGTDNPGKRLHLRGSSGSGVIRIEDNTSPYVEFFSGASTRAGYFGYGANTTDFYIQNEANGFFAVATNNTERLRIISTGEVGIGNAVPGSFYSYFNALVVGANSAYKGMTIYATTAGGIAFADSTTGSAAYQGLIWFNHSYNFVGINADGSGYDTTYALTVDSNGKVGIGTYNGDCKFEIKAGVANICNSGADGTMTECIRFQLSGSVGTSNWRNSIYSSVSTNDYNSIIRFSLASSQTTQRNIFCLYGSGDIVCNPRGTALATNANYGFLFIPTCAGTPTGTPSSFTGAVALVYDTSNNKLYAYNGAWKSVTLA